MRFVSNDPNRVHATARVAWTLIPPHTQISIVGLVGFLEGSDRYGALRGLTQTIGIWGKPR